MKLTTKKYFLLLTTIIVTLNGYSQISFEKGYIINNSGEKTDCFIKNLDWKNNPTDLEYKLSENSDIIKTNITSVKEFAIDNNSKYIKASVKIDKSSEDIAHLSYNRNPVYVDEQLFLKVLIEGKANLYYYENGNLQRFFYNNDSSNIEQLVYKKYLPTENEIGTNEFYKQQLWNNLKCSSINENQIELLKYKKSDLSNFFIEYNKCNDSNYKNYEAKGKKDLFNLTFRGYLNNSSFSLQNPDSLFPPIDFGSKSGFSFGIEAEFILPYNKNKWSIAVETTYSKFKAEKTIDVDFVSGDKMTTTIDYSSLDIPISLRHYFFLDKNSKLFVDASYILTFNPKSSILFTRADNSLFDSIAINSQNNLAFGLGYKFKDKFVLGMRYQTNRNIVQGSSYFNTNYKTLSLLLGYSLF